MDTLTTTQAAELLKKHNINVTAQTVKKWCQNKYIPGAYRLGSKYGGLWVIPLDSLIGALETGTIPPRGKRGRKPDENPSPLTLAKRRSRERSNRIEQ
jgi:hypothetical protein